MVCHCLLVETEQGLVLVDSGLGLADVRDPAGSLGSKFVKLTRPRLDPDETALRQVTRLGYRPTDVRHVILTHLDLDHAGGIGDFPWATVHVHAREHEAAMRRATGSQRMRYRPNHWAHDPMWATYSDTDGEQWFGFDAVRQIKGVPPEILLIPLAGHTHGHSGVAVDAGDRWLLHAGDAYFFHGEADPQDPHCPPGMRLFQNLVQVDRRSRLANRVRLRDLRAAQGGMVDVFCAHDDVELARLMT